VLAVYFDSEKAEVLADPLADHRRAFTDAARKHEGVYSTERCGVGADPLRRWQKPAVSAANAGKAGRTSARRRKFTGYTVDGGYARYAVANAS
jgi:hypothetical protein